MQPPAIEAKNSTGCGDALTGSLAFALSRKMELTSALKLSVATASASACDLIPGKFSRERQAELLKGLRVRELRA